MTTAYFVREDVDRFRPTPLVGGAWAQEEQHIAPAIGLIAHCIELDRNSRRGDDLQLARLSCDIFGVVPIEAMELKIEVLRPGRTIELVEARLSHDGRTVVLARAWLAQRVDTTAYEGSSVPLLPGPAVVPAWSLEDSWPGAFVQTLDTRRAQTAPGSAITWLQTPVPLLAGEAVSATATALGLMDTANGTTPRIAPERMAFPNLDLTVHLFRSPTPGPLGMDVRVSFGPDGLGLTQTTLHDKSGPFGGSAQVLTLRPR